MSASLRLHQPHLPRAQQDLHLESDAAVFAASPAGVARYQLSFPLPGARQGRAYLLYLRLPDAPGRCEIGHALSDGGFAGGFLIQTTGRHRGLTEFVSGEVRTSSALAAPAKRRGQLRLRCGDGTQLTGEFTAQRDDRAVRDFEERDCAADVAALLRARAATSRPR
jgi:hypothetical protein